MTGLPTAPPPSAGLRADAREDCRNRFSCRNFSETFLVSAPVKSDITDHACLHALPLCLHHLGLRLLAYNSKAPEKLKLQKDTQLMQEGPSPGGGAGSHVIRFMMRPYVVVISYTPAKNSLKGVC